MEKSGDANMLLEKEKAELRQEVAALEMKLVDYMEQVRLWPCLVLPCPALPLLLVLLPLVTPWSFSSPTSSTSCGVLLFLALSF